MRKFLIFTPSYSERNGGAIVLHKLCDLINASGREAYLFPFVDNLELNKFNYPQVLAKFFKKNLRESFRILKINRSFNTPVIKKLPKNIANDEWIVVYPEIAFGNPLGAKNVVRWLLHNPGFDPNTGIETANFYYGKGELYFRIGNWFKDFYYPGSTTSPSFLQVFYYPLDLYNLDNTSTDRIETAYCIRKGKHKKIVHDLSGSILVDGMKHKEMAKIFKRVKTFISYDSYTTLSTFASLCGCDSVVIPDEGISEGQWLPNPKDRYGIAYGFENIEYARSTRKLLLSSVKEIEASSSNSVKNFINETDDFFNSKLNGQLNKP